MNTFSLCIIILFASVFIGYFAWKLIKYIAYNRSHLVAKGMNNACNSGIMEKEMTVSLNDAPVQINKVEIVLSSAEKRIRSDWLRSLYIYILGVSTFNLICYFLISLADSGH